MNESTDIFVVAGSSGCGKDTLTAEYPSLSYFNDLDPAYYESKIYKLVPFTTRAKRPGEEDFVTYDFIPDISMNMNIEGAYSYTQNIRNHFPPGTEYWDLRFYEERRYNVITETGEEKTNYYGNFIGNIVPGKKYIVIGQFDTYNKLRLHVRNMDRIFGFSPKDEPKLNIKLIWLTLPLKEKIHRLVKRENEKENPNMEELIRRIVSDEITAPSNTIFKDLFYKILDSVEIGEDLNEVLKNVCLFDTSESIEDNKLEMRTLLRNDNYFKNSSLFHEMKTKIILDESISEDPEIVFYRNIIEDHMLKIQASSIEEMVYKEDRFLNFYMETVFQNKRLLNAIFNDT